LSSYVPSLAERMWFDGQRVDGRICAIAASDEHVESQAEALRLAQRVRAGERVLPLGDTPTASKHVSRLLVCEAGTGPRKCQLEPIEPLVGIARHPLADIGCEIAPAGAEHPPAPDSRKNMSRVFDISHLILHSKCKPASQPDDVARRRVAQDARRLQSKCKPAGCKPEKAQGARRQQRMGMAPGRRLEAAQQPRAEAVGSGGTDGSARKPRNLLFDVGCTVWAPPGSSHPSSSSSSPVGSHSSSQVAAAGTARAAALAEAEAEAALAGSARGPSLPLFRSLYARQCVDFDHMWGWEATPYDQREWWSHVPPEVRPKLTFVNKPVVLGGGSELDPLLTIAREARREDFVVLKLDIDTFHVERKIVREIMTNARGTNASWLIDELFFEYHFALEERGRHLVRSVRKAGWQKAGPTDVAPLMHWWGGDDAVASGKRGGTVEDALALMRTLRERLGIRAHFWI
jgi:hypothetical protein